jgi:hypothetical protein
MRRFSDRGEAEYHGFKSVAAYRRATAAKIKRIEKLKRMTVANGCTEAEAEAAVSRFFARAWIG